MLKSRSRRMLVIELRQLRSVELPAEKIGGQTIGAARQVAQMETQGTRPDVAHRRCVLEDIFANLLQTEEQLRQRGMDTQVQFAQPGLAFQRFFHRSASAASLSSMLDCGFAL